MHAKLRVTLCRVRAPWCFAAWSSRASLPSHLGVPTERVNEASSLSNPAMPALVHQGGRPRARLQSSCCPPRATHGSHSEAVQSTGSQLPGKLGCTTQRWRGRCRAPVEGPNRATAPYLTSKAAARARAQGSCQHQGNAPACRRQAGMPPEALPYRPFRAAPTAAAGRESRPRSRARWAARWRAGTPPAAAPRSR